MDKEKETKETKKKETVSKKNKNEELIEKLQTELAEAKDKSMRIQAEMLNFRKRKEEEVEKLYKYANEDILKKLLLIVDNFERAIKFENEDNK